MLFFIRFKRHSFSENILFVFTGLSFLSSSLWLYLNYYNNSINEIVDFFGIYIENVLLATSVIYIYSLGKKSNKKSEVVFYSSLFIISFILYLIHYKIADASVYIFHPSNKNVLYNIVFQIIIDITLFSVFLFLFGNKKSSENSELFDGNFKRYILFAFSFYFVQDILILSLFIFALNQIVLPDLLMNITLLLNTVITIFLVMAAIYTNWLKEYNKLRNSQNKLETTKFILSIEELKSLNRIDWNEIYIHFSKSHNEIVNKIEKNDSLSPTEKMYAFFDYFNFSSKELSEILFVSVRTVETNFYRMRRKLKN